MPFRYDEMPFRLLSNGISLKRNGISPSESLYLNSEKRSKNLQTAY